MFQKRSKRLSGYTVQEAIGMDMAREVYLHSERRNQFLNLLKENGRVNSFEAELVRKDGSVWWASTNARFFKDKTGEIAGVEGITRDITPLKKTIAALHESEERFRLTFETSPDAISLTRFSDGAYININQGFTELTGYTPEDLKGKSALDIKIWHDPRDRERMVQALENNGHMRNLEARFLRKNGIILVGLMSAAVFPLNGEKIILSITREITELKNAQEMLIQSEKMLTVGGLSAGMAHEINNPLAGMVQNAEMIFRRLSDPGLPANTKAARELGLDLDLVKAYMEQRDILKMAASVKESGLRISRIVQNMLSFSRKNDDTISMQRLPRLIEDTIELAKTDFSLKKHYDFKKIQIRKNYEKALPKVAGDATKLQQVFFNILSNGAHAMQEAEIQDPSFCISMKKDDVPGWVIVEISDNGPGMAPEVKKRVFEPFFTTKPPGSGTGLGLSVSYFIITRFHHGEIQVDSQKGEGAKFTIRLPVSAESIKPDRQLSSSF